jgi:hypothetical protein
MKIKILIIFCIVIFGGSIANSGSNKEEDELQNKCCQKAAQVFKNEMAKNAGAFRVSNYYCHYNKRMNKCFMLEIFAIKIGDPLTKMIVDVNENRLSGFCGEGAVDNKYDCESPMWKSILKETMEE